MTSDPGDFQSQGPQPRIGDAERQAAVEALSEHYVAGRLDETEFNQRMDVAMQARTTAELGPLFSDLPPLDALGPAPAHQALQPYVPAYDPAIPPTTGSTPATTGGRSRVQTLQLVRTLVWPVAVGLFLFTGIDLFFVLGAAIITSIVVGKMLDNEKRATRELPPPDPDDGRPGERP